VAPRRRGRWWRLPLWSLAGLLALLLLASGGLWVWTGTDGSLATALRWAGAQQPLVTDEVTGTVRGGGKVRRLAWEKEGLRVEVHDAELLWTPAALLARTLQIDQLAASRIVIDDQRAPGEPSAGPPESFALPLNIRVKALRAGELRWAGPPPYTLSDVAGRFDYDGARHLLELDSARIEGGSYRLRAAATAHAPIRVDVALAGALTAPVPGAEAPVPRRLPSRRCRRWPVLQRHPPRRHLPHLRRRPRPPAPPRQPPTSPKPTPPPASRPGPRSRCPRRTPACARSMWAPSGPRHRAPTSRAGSTSHRCPAPARPAGRWTPTWPTAPPAPGTSASCRSTSYAPT